MHELQVKSAKISKNMVCIVSRGLFQLQKHRPDTVGAGDEMPVKAVDPAAGGILAGE